MGDDIFHSVLTELLSPQINDLSQTTPEYRDYLHQLYFNFKTEIIKNIIHSDLINSLQYLNELLLCFKTIEKTVRLKLSSQTTFKRSEKTVQEHGLKIIIYLIKKKIRLVKYMIDHRQALDNHFSFKSPQQSSRFRWLTTDTALLELSVALAKSKAVGDESGKEINPKDIAEGLSELFGTRVEYIESKISKAKNRKKDSSPFLTQLKNCFEIFSFENLEK